MDKIKIKNLKFSYEDIDVFKNFNHEINKNMFNIVVGESGIGKTTFLRILLGLEKYTGDIIGMEKGNTSVVFQENRLLEDNTILENINFVQKTNLEKKYIEIEMGKVGLTCSSDKKIKELSGGMKRRVSILRSILYNADTYIFDEPFKELDSENYNLVINYVKEKLESKTVILTTHNKKEIEFFNANLINLE